MPSGEGSFFFPNGNMQPGKYLVTENQGEEGEDGEPIVTRSARWVGEDLRLQEPIVPPPDDNAIING